MIVQPMRPAASAATKFWFGMPASAARAWASSRSRTASMRTSAALRPPSRSATQASARRRPRWSVSITGPQIVDSTVSVSAFSPVTSIVSTSRSSGRGPSGVR